MAQQFSKTASRLKRHARLRRKVIGTAERPRLMFARTLHHIYATVIDDAKGHTLVSASTRQKDVAAGLGSHTGSDAARSLPSVRKQRASKRSCSIQAGSNITVASKHSPMRRVKRG